MVPTQLTAGNTWAWTHEVTDYPATTYTGTYYVQNAEQSFAISTTASGTAFAANDAASATATRHPGKYRWVLLCTLGSDRYTADEGEVEILPDPAYALEYDFRSSPRKRLEMIDAYLEDATNLAAASYSIGGRSLSRWNRADLIAERERCAAMVTAEDRAASKAKGERLPRLSVRF